MSHQHSWSDREPCKKTWGKGGRDAHNLSRHAIVCKRSIGTWNGRVEKCTRRLTNWKSQYLSRGGRLTRINSILDTLPSYLMFIFPIPATVSRIIYVRRRKFFWQGNDDKKKDHQVKWEELLIDKKTGGLSI